jgi:UDP-glucose:(heptosyl)LPS alpha-1,3-glucosyltransferase
MTRDARAPITLAVIRRRYSPFGGAERFIERSLHGLAKTGVRPTLVCAEWDRAEADVPDCEVVRLGTPKGLGRARRELAFERDVHGFLARRRFDLVQSHERIAGLPVFRAGDGLHCEWLRQRRKAQSVMAQWLTRISPYHGFCLDRERQLFGDPGLRIVICNSEMVRSEIAEHFPGALHKVRVVRNGIDTRLFCQTTDPQRQQARVRLGLTTALPVILYVGSGFERKGVATILRAAALVPKAQFLLVGQDKHIQRYQRRAAELAVADRVHFLGARDDVPSCLDAADAFIFPTLYDPGPNAVLEAMAKGLPVLTSDKCGLAELIAPARAGFVHDALDVESFAGSLNKLLDPAQRRSMGAAARVVAEGLSLDALTTNLRKLYEELLP